MTERYKIVHSEGQGEIIEKKSRFIAAVMPVATEGEAVAFIEATKKKHWNASHNCSTFVIGLNNEITRCSDDGEPSGTAGRPMLDVLLGEQLHNVCVVVTRYFGGTLLGTGGLVRAYSRAVQEGLKNCEILERCLAKRIRIMVDYSGIGKIQYLLAQAGISAIDSRYAEDVELTVLIPVSQVNELSEMIMEGTNGRASLEVLDEVYI